MDEEVKYCRMFLVRHGESEWNVLGLVQGHMNSPLTPRGEEQAQVTAEILRDVEFDEIFSSDLVRAKRTAEIVKLERELEVLTTEALREQHFGSLEGQPSQELRAHFEKWKFLSNNAERFAQRFVPDMETAEEALTRLITFLREIAVAYAGKTVLIATHGTLMHNFLLKLNYAFAEELVKVENGAFIELESDGIDFFIRHTYGIRLTDDDPLDDDDEYEEE